MGSYHFKNIMLGAGIGLVISSMVNINMNSRELTIDEIKKESEKHGLIILTEEEILNSQPRADEPSPSPVNEISVEIKSGMGAEDIAAILKEKGIIKDERSFLNRLKELGKESMLRLGSYKIQLNLNYDEIIDILTK